MAKTNSSQADSGIVMAPKDVKAMMIQHEREAALPSLLFVARKLGEVEGILSLQSQPDTALLDVQVDLKRLYVKLVEDAGVEQSVESSMFGIGGDRL